MCWDFNVRRSSQSYVKREESERIAFAGEHRPENTAAIRLSDGNIPRIWKSFLS